MAGARPLNFRYQSQPDQPNQNDTVHPVPLPSTSRSAAIAFAFCTPAGFTAGIWAGSLKRTPPQGCALAATIHTRKQSSTLKPSQPRLKLVTTCSYSTGLTRTFSTKHKSFVHRPETWTLHCLQKIEVLARHLVIWQNMF